MPRASRSKTRWLTRARAWGCDRVIHEEANDEFRVALDYYAEIGPELGVRFYREMERLMHEVCEHPLLFRQFDPLPGGTSPIAFRKASSISSSPTTCGSSP